MVSEFRSFRPLDFIIYGPMVRLCIQLGECDGGELVTSQRKQEEGVQQGLHLSKAAPPPISTTDWPLSPYQHMTIGGHFLATVTQMAPQWAAVDTFKGAERVLCQPGKHFQVRSPEGCPEGTDFLSVWPEAIRTVSCTLTATRPETEGPELMFKSTLTRGPAHTLQK